MTDTEKVTTYIQKRTQWSDQLLQLRSVFQKTELKEEVKWGTPTYTLNGKPLAGMAGFKSHFAIWFHQGVFLKDSGKKRINAQEGTTRGLRQWRFETGDGIDADLVLDYLHESIENCLAGKEIKPQRKKGLNIPPYLKAAFKANSKFENTFTNLTPGKQRKLSTYR